MKRKLIRSGSGWAMFVSKTLLELLNVNPEIDFLDIEVEKDVLKIKKHEEKTT